MQHQGSPVADCARHRGRGLDQVHGGILGPGQRIGMGFGLFQQGKFFSGESGLAHPLQQGNGWSGRALARLAGQYQIPVDILVIGRTRQLAVADGEHFLVLLLVEGVAGGHIGAYHAGQVVGRLPQFVRQQERLQAGFVGAVDLFFGAHIHRESKRNGHQRGQAQPELAGKAGRVRSVGCHGVPACDGVRLMPSQIRRARFRRRP